MNIKEKNIKDILFQILVKTLYIVEEALINSMVYLCNYKLLLIKN